MDEFKAVLRIFQPTVCIVWHSNRQEFGWFGRFIKTNQAMNQSISSNRFQKLLSTGYYFCIFRSLCRSIDPTQLEVCASHFESQCVFGRRKYGLLLWVRCVAARSSYTVSPGALTLKHVYVGICIAFQLRISIRTMSWNGRLEDGM